MSLDLPAFAVGLFCAGALAASMSTGDALLHAAGSIMVRDFVCVLSPRSLTERQQTRLIRTFVLIISAFAYYFAVVSELSLVALLLLAYGFLVQIAPVLVATFYWPRATPQGVLSGLVVGCGVVILFYYVPALQWQQVQPGIFGLAANLVTLVAVSLLTAPMDEAHVEQFVVS